MFGFDLNILIVVILAAIAAGAIVYAVLFNTISAERQSKNRFNRFASGAEGKAHHKAKADRAAELGKRRKSVQDSLKELEDKNKAAKKQSHSLKDKLQQAGLSIEPKQYYIFSAISGLVIAFIAFISSQDALVAAGSLFVGGVGLPMWFIAYLRKRRFKAFLNEFPNALDVMVRSIKSGLPLNDAVRLIASDGNEPVRSEFERMMEGQQIGMSVPEACTRMFNRIPLPEVNFFAVVINIQAQAGGNLSEALGNLSAVLRARKQMKAKVAALSMEAKASAAIIGSLPFIVAGLVYISSPDYIMQLFTDVRGHIIIGVSLVWMAIGVLVMKNMINFEV